MNFTQEKRNMRLLVASNAISDVGNWISRIATLSLVLQVYGTAASTSMVSIVSLIPYILFSPIAGKAADRYDKKKMLIAGDFLRAFFVLLIPFFPGKLLILLFLTSLVSVFTDLCGDSIVPMLVQKQRLQRLNSINESMSALVMVLGPSLSGVLISFVALDLCFFLDAASFLVSAILRFGIKYKTDELHAEAGPQGTDPSGGTFWEVVRYICTNPKLTSIVATVTAVGLAAGMLNSLLIVYVYNYMNQTSAGYGVLLSAKGIAMLAASALLVKINGKIATEPLFCYSLLGLGASLLVFPMNTVFSVGIAIQMVNGVCNAGYSIARISLLQSATEQSCLGRVLSVNTLISNVLSVTSLGVFGILADKIGVRAVLIIGGGIVTAAAIFSIFMCRKADKRQNVPQAR